MSKPSLPIPAEQVRAFNLAVCKRLGIDPAIVSEHNFSVNVEVVGGEELGKLSVSLDAFLPAEEILAMFNGRQSA